MTTVELEFLCDFCRRPIADRMGCVIVRYSDLSEWRRQDAAWRTANPGDGAHTLAAIFAKPGPVSWRIQHDACNPDSSEDGYDIGVDKVRTWRELLAWTAHLMEKSWLPLTDWPVVIGSAARGDGGRIVPAAVRGDAA